MSERVVVIGGDPGGMAAASQIRRRRPEIDVIALERGEWTSYSACGIPYVVGGIVEGGVERLVARSPEEHRGKRHRRPLGARGDGHRPRQSARSRSRPRDGGAYRLGYDQLLIATGGSPIRPALPGIDLPFVHGVQSLDDGGHLLRHAEELASGCQRIVVVGSGYIGLEMAEAFVDRGCTATVVEQAAQPMGTLDPDMGELVADAMKTHGLTLRTEVEVTGFEPGRVLTSDGPLDADLVVLGIGVGPNAGLAEEAGVDLGAKGSIRVDERQETSSAGVWAAGDCCESRHLVTGEPVHIALGTYANRQSRVAGINISGGQAVFPGVLGTAISKICDTEIARTGLGTDEAEQTGLDVVASRIEATTHAGYYPEADPMTVKLIVRAGDRTAARRADRRWTRGRQAHRHLRRRDHRRVHRPAGHGPGPGVRAAVLQRVGPGGRGRSGGVEAGLRLV